jgi:hypothetical protein
MAAPDDEKCPALNVEREEKKKLTVAKQVM